MAYGDSVNLLKYSVDVSMYSPTYQVGSCKGEQMCNTVLEAGSGSNLYNK